MLFKKRLTESQLTAAKFGFVPTLIGVTFCYTFFKLRGKIEGIQIAIPLSWDDIGSGMPVILLVAFIAGLIAYFGVLREESRKHQGKK